MASGLVARRWSYRRGQTSLLFMLSLLVIVACAAGPFYERAVEDATVRSTLTQAPVVDRGISLDLTFHAPLAQLVPGGAAATLFQAPITGTDLPTTAVVNGRSYKTQLSSRLGDCQHVHLVAGRCPTGDNQLMLSASSARVLHLSVGQSIVLSLPDPNRPVANLVTGLFAPFAVDNDYWYGRSYYASSAGVYVDDAGTHIDSVFGSASFVQRQAAAGQQYVTNGNPNPFVPDQFADLPLRPDRVGVDQLGTLSTAVARVGSFTQTAGVAQFTSNLPSLLDSIDHGRSQARTIIYALAAQLALLALIAFGVVVAASIDQRRPELALARLRGRGTGRAAGVVAREIGGVVLLAAVPGVLIAYGLAELAARRWLVSGVSAQWTWPVLAATAGAVLVALVLVRIVAARAGRAPITDLLRQVPVRGRSTGLGLAEAAVGAGAAAGLVTIGSGSRHNALATLAPTLIAVLVGLLAGRAVVALGRVVGARALARGNVVRGLAALTIGRRSGHRLAITALCVATALVVFAGQQWSVASANRTQRALAQTGARVVLSVATPSAGVLQQAVDQADPDGHYATPVVVEQPPGIDAARTVAIDPRSFGSVASWGRSSLAASGHELAAVAPGRLPPPITLTGVNLSLRLGGLSVTKLAVPAQPGEGPGEPQPPATPAAVTVALLLRDSTGQVDTVEFGSFRDGTHSATTLTAETGCLSGCRLVGIEFERPPLDTNPASITATVQGVGVLGSPLRPVGTASQWASTTPVADMVSGAGKDQLQVSPGPSGSVTFRADDDGAGSSAQYLNQPLGLPALLTPGVALTNDDLGFLTATSIDGQTTRVRRAGSIDFVPQVGANAVVVDLGLAAAQAGGLNGAAQVWLSADDPGREKAFVQSLAKRGITVVERQSSAQALSAFTHSSPAWSAQLTIVVAVLAGLIAAALLVLLLSSSRRSRVRDLAGARLVGLGRSTVTRVLRLELAAVVASGTVLGLIVGVIGVRLALPSVPIFTSEATVPLPVVYPMVWLWLVGCLVALLAVLVLAAGLATQRVAADVRPDAVFGER